MKIAIVGASGHIGNAVAVEALSRGHEVTAIARAPEQLDLEGVRVVAADIRDRASVASALEGQDTVIVSIAGRKAGDRDTVPTAARTLLEVLPEVGVERLVFVGGGGSLERIPGERFLDAPEFPAEYKQEALEQAEALEVFRETPSVVRWSYASPPPVHMIDGARTGSYRVAAGDRPITDADGESRITVKDYAAALVDVAENGSFVNERFTVAY